MANLLIFVVLACLSRVDIALGKLVFQETSLPCHRLPLNVRPTAYEVHLKFASLDSDEYEGQVNISVKFESGKAVKVNEKAFRAGSDIAKSVQETQCELGGSPNQIVLHADESLQIEDIKVRSEAHLGCLSGGGMRKREIVKLMRNRAKQMIAIRLKRGAYPGSRGKITISFRGKMRKDKRGIYVSTYKDGDQIYKHIVSQFQATDARTAFPCFDEPRFKVPFSLKISHPQKVAAYGNTDVKSSVIESANSLETTTFITTPKMPVHMVGFTVGQFAEPLETVSTYYFNGTTSLRNIRVITAPGKRHTAHFALGVAKSSLETFEQYIDFEYPLSKLDIIAIADHERGNTETWGLGFVRDTLIWIDDETKMDTRITTAVNVAHIVVHQWFANLISCAWWTDLWITEGVASQFAFRLVHMLYRRLGSEYFLRLATLEEAMNQDQWGMSTVHALSPAEKSMRSNEEIDKIFSKLEFTKSGALAQMVMDAVGDTWYQKTLRRLIADNAFGAVNFDDYVRALTNNGERRFEEVIQMMRTFAAYKGISVLNVVESESCSSNVTLSMEYFNFAKENMSNPAKVQFQDLTIYTTVTVWPTTRSVFMKDRPGKPYFENVHAPTAVEIPSGQRFVQLSRNPSMGAYYRTRYTDKLYDLLKPAIEKKDIDTMGRIQILSDANSLVHDGLITDETFMKILDSYSNESHGAVILQMLLASKTLSKFNMADVKSTAIMQVFLNLFDKYGYRVYDWEPVMMERAREETLKALINQGNQDVIEAGVRTYEDSDGQVALFVRAPVYASVVLTDHSSYVAQLFDKLERCKSYEETIRLITALSLSKNKQHLERLQGWLNSSDLKEETIEPFLKTISGKLEE